MLERAEKVHLLVNRKISRGSSNTKNASQEVIEKVSLIKSIDHVIVDYKKHPDVFLILTRKMAKKVITGRDLNLFSIVTSGLLAELFQCGNCGEQAALGFLEFIKIGFDKSLEFIDVGNDSDEHQLLVLNRDAKHDINRLEDWQEIILFDTWNGAHLRSYSGTHHPKINDLGITRGHEKISIKSILRLENNLSATEWSDLIIYLQNLRLFLTPTNLSYCLLNANIERKVSPTRFNLEEESKKISDRIAQEIKHFLELKKHPPSFSPIMDNLLALGESKEEKEDRITVPYKPGSGNYFTALAGIIGEAVPKKATEAIEVNTSNYTVSFFVPWLKRLPSEASSKILENCGIQCRLNLNPFCQD